VSYAEKKCMRFTGRLPQPVQLKQQQQQQQPRAL